MANKNQTRARVDIRTVDSITHLAGMGGFEKSIAGLEMHSRVQLEKPLGGLVTRPST